VLIAVERHGPVRAVSVESEKVDTLQPIIDQHLCKSSHLMSDMHRSHVAIGKQFSAKSYVNHSQREFSRGNVHTNTAESFTAIVKRARVGVFHYMSRLHLDRYMSEFEFRWNHRVADEVIDKKGRCKTVMRPIPIIDMIVILIMQFSGYCLKRTSVGGLKDAAFNL
jgi:hypothetical protein